MAIKYSKTPVELREVVLRDKPQAMLEVSEKATVPLLILPTGEVIDESLDINDPENWLMSDTSASTFRAQQLIAQNDNAFKQHLDRYKYADLNPQQPQSYYRALGEEFLALLERHLEEQRFLLSVQFCIAGISFP